MEHDIEVKAHQDQNQQPSLRTSIKKSSLTGVAQFVINTVLVFSAIPIFVRKLGAEQYGVFSLVALVGNVNTFANLGLSPALVRFLASQGKSRESDYDIIVTFAMLLVIVLPLALIGFLLQREILIVVFNIPVYLLAEGKWLFNSTLCGSVLVLLGQTFSAILESQQKIYLTNTFQMIYNCFYWILILVSIFLGFGLKGVAAGTFIATLIWFCIVLFSALHSWGGISLTGLKDNYRRIAKKQLSYGLQVYAAGVVGFFHEPITRILISRFIGVPEAGLFDIALRVRNQAVGLVMKLLSPLYPAISQISDNVKLRALVHDVEQKTFLFVLPVSAVIMLVTRPAVGLVFHAHVDETAITVICIVVAYLLFSTTVLPIYLFLMARGQPSKTILIQGLNVCVNAAVFFILLHQLGYYSAVVSNVAAIATTFGVLLFFQKKFLDSLIFENSGQLFRVIVSFAVVLGLGFVATILSSTQAMALVVVPVVVAIVTVFVYRQFDLFSSRDIARYFGDGNLFSRISSYLLLRKVA